MKKRLCKKLYHGEFQEWGFFVEWRFVAPANAQGLMLLLEAFVGFLETHGLTFGGGSEGQRGSGFVCKAWRGSTTEAERTLVAHWFKELDPQVEATLGPMEDAWHSPNRQFAQCKNG